MIDHEALLEDLQALVEDLRADIRERVEEQADLSARLREEHRSAREAARTGEAYETWREEPITQAAVAWILGCVFVRFLEDNGLVETPRLSGPGERLNIARDHHTLYFQRHPTESDREYLLHVFTDVGQLRAAREIFDRAHNPLWSLQVSGDGARKLLDLWQRIDPATGALVHDFTDPEWATRFLGDLYQDLSEDARKRYALLQTPEFVEEFILDRTLTPAIETFGYREVRLIDPTCGSGHFLLGAFKRLFDLRLKHEPGTNVRELAQRALDGVWGVDINPFAVAIARFRLLIAALKSTGIARLKDAPAFTIHLAIGDSLLHGPRFVGNDASLIPTSQMSLNAAEDPLRHVYATEDREALRAVLGQRYHAVVGNPPYITVKDNALNEAYRKKYSTCHMKYSLAVPFMERFFELAMPGLRAATETNEQSSAPQAGYVGMITSNGFMKREFGKKLIESFIPRWDLTHVLDTSGAYIPGHGTPTVILFGRNRLPVQDTVRAVMGIRGEPTTPEDPSRGLVWTAIVSQVDQPGSSSDWVSVSDTARAGFHNHPWSIGGGGAAELKVLLETRASQRLEDLVESIGFLAITGEDDAFVVDDRVARLFRTPSRPFVIGDGIRDWSTGDSGRVVFPYSEDLENLPALPASGMLDFSRWSWPLRTTLATRSMFGKTPFEHGFEWYEYLQFIRARAASKLLIAFAEVASHNHFVLDRGGKVFKQTAPVIKLPDGATEDDHFSLLGLLNSSTACFWMKQVAHQKQMTGGDGVRVESRAKVPYQLSGTQLGELPISESCLAAPLRGRLRDLARAIDEAARQFGRLTGAAAIASNVISGASAIRRAWEAFQQERQALRGRMIRLQEEIDFCGYAGYGLADESLLDSQALAEDVSVKPGERPFCLIAGRNEDGHVVPEGVPEGWPAHLREVWVRRIAAIRASAELSLIEDSHYKRRWIGRQGLFNWNRDRDDLADAAASWLLDRLETIDYWPSLEVQSCARLGDRAQSDREFMVVAELYRGRADFDVTALVTELVEAEAVPFLPVLRYKASGLQKRALWERTWELQRREDAGEEVGTIEVPPKFSSADFLKGDYGRLRGKLDLPKERFISYPGCGRAADPSLLVGWAGWDHLQQAKALAGYYVAMKDTEGWPRERLVPLLAGLLEVLPWVEQWHNTPDPAYGTGIGEYFRPFVDEEARSWDLTLDAIRAWKPEAGVRPRRRGPRRPKAS